MAIVLKQFPWSPDGFTVEILNPGNERNFGAAQDGLASEGFVLGGEVEPVVEPVVEPAEEAPVEPVVEPVVEAPHPLDHDGDGKPGGSLPKAKRGKR